MAYVDPWEGYTRGVKSLSDAAAMARQADLDKMAKANWEMKHASAVQARDDEQSLRSAIKEAATPKDVATDVANPAYKDYQQGLSAYETAQYPPEPKRGVAPDIESSMGLSSGVTFDRGGASEFRMPSTPTTTPEENSAQLAGTAPPQTLSQTTRVAPHPLKAIIDAAKAHPENPLAQSSLADAQKQLTALTTQYMATGNGEAAVKLLNEISGTNDLKWLGQKGEMATVKGQNGTFMYNVTQMAKDIHTGMPVADAWKKNAVQVDEKQGKIIDKYIPLGNKVFIQYTDGTTEEKPVTASPNTIVKVEAANAAKDGSGELPVPVIKLLEPKAAAAQQGANLVTTFDKDYTVTPSLLQNLGITGMPKNLSEGIVALKKQYGEDAPATQFWMDYQTWVNETRKELFGTALTKTEKPEFDKITVNPGMSPVVIEARLKKQSELANTAFNRIQSSQTPSKKFGKTVETVYPKVGEDTQSAGGMKLPTLDEIKAERARRAGGKK